MSKPNEDQKKKELPHSFEAEQAVLASIISDAESYYLAADIIKEPEYFYDRKHQTIYEACQDLVQESQPIDLITLTDKLKSKKKLQGIGGHEALNLLSEYKPVIQSNCKHHASIVKDYFIKRTVIKTGEQLVKKSYDSSVKSDLLLQQAEALIHGIESEDLEKHNLSVLKALDEYIQILQKRQESDNQMLGISTGFFKLDMILAGLQGAALYTLAARPGIGKTSLALCMARNIAAKDNKHVMFLSLEMSHQQLMQRMICTEAMLDSNVLRNMKLEDEDWDKVFEAYNKLISLKLTINDQPNINIFGIKNLLIKNKLSGNPVDILFIDYLQLIDAGHIQNRTEQVSYISRQLKLISREFNIPVIALSQLSRAVEQRPDKRPQLSDLRDSGSVEQDSDVVMFIYRKSYYDENADPNEAELIVSKQRSGPVGTIPLKYEGKYTKFSNEYLNKKF